MTNQLNARLDYLAGQIQKMQNEAAVLAIKVIAIRVRRTRPDAHMVKVGWGEDRHRCIPLGCYDQDGTQLGWIDHSWAGTRDYYDDWEHRLHEEITPLTHQLTEDNTDVWFAHTIDEAGNGKFLDNGERFIVIADALKLPDPDLREQRVDLRTELVRLHDGDGTRTILELADHVKVAVAYLDRTWFNSYLEECHGRKEPLTDDEWFVQLGCLLDTYDEHVGEYRAFGRDSIEHEFADDILREAGILPDDDKEDEDQEDEDQEDEDQEEESGGGNEIEDDTNEGENPVDPLGVGGVLAAGTRAALVLGQAREVVDNAEVNDGE